MSGSTPEGVRGEAETARWVRAMFGRVAHRYDLANHLLSCNIDRYWRAHTVRRTRDILLRPEARAKVATQGRRVVGSDFCHPMLVAAHAKIARRRAPAVLFESDALTLPLRDGSLDLLTVAFGFRNLANYEAGLVEMRRVLAPGGMAAILEFSQPPNAVFGAFYNFYARRILPWIGGLISGSRGAYTYLPESVRKFPSAGELAAMMRRAGFAEVSFEYLTGGIVALHIGRIP
jgi:demethylmenaquinone methyltransferase/2-methoxy-6-polyprenyl-1,4-benzoquinol methylase